MQREQLFCAIWRDGIMFVEPFREALRKDALAIGTRAEVCEYRFQYMRGQVKGTRGERVKS